MSITVQKVFSRSFERPVLFLGEALHTGQSTFILFKTPFLYYPIPVEKMPAYPASKPEVVKPVLMKQNS